MSKTQAIHITGAFLSAAILLCSPNLLAQVSGVTVVNNLTFGDVFPGIPKEVDEQTPGRAAEFEITGIAGSEVTIEFMLPTYMNDGGYNMPLLFRQTDCSLDSSSTPDQTNPLFPNQDPWKTITYGIGSGGIKVWLGGKVVPRIQQKDGSYSADIVITVTYIGT